MAKKRIATTGTEHEQFSSVAPDLEIKNQRALVDELYRKNWPGEAMDAYEQRNGMPVTQAPKVPEEYDHKLFDLSYDRDSKLFNKLMNGEGYRILYMKDTFTPDGSYRMMVIYSKTKVDTKETENKEEE